MRKFPDRFHLKIDVCPPHGDILDERFFEGRAVIGLARLRVEQRDAMIAKAKRP